MQTVLYNRTINPATATGNIVPVVDDLHFFLTLSPYETYIRAELINIHPDKSAFKYSWL